MSDFKKEERYLVFKLKDIEKYCLVEQKIDLDFIVQRINKSRIKDGKGIVDCVVVESDWPMYGDIWEMIKQHVETGKYKSLQKQLAAVEKERDILEINYKQAMDSINEVVRYKRKLQKQLAAANEVVDDLKKLANDLIALKNDEDFEFIAKGIAVGFKETLSKYQEDV